MSEPRFFSFRKPPDWWRGMSYQLDMSENGVSIQSEYVYRQDRRYSMTHQGLTPPWRQIVLDRKGRWFIMDKLSVIWRTDLTSTYAERVMSTTLSKSGELAQFTVIQDGVIVMLPEAQTILQSISIENSQIRWTVMEYESIPFYGLAMTGDHEQGLIVLANLGSSDEVQILRFSASGTALANIPLPMIDKVNVSDIEEGRFELSVDSSGNGWLLDRKQQKVVQLMLTTNTVREFPIPADAGSIVSICGSVQDMLWVLQDSDRGLDSTLPLLVHLHQDGTVLERGYIGRENCDRVIVDKDCVYLIDTKERHIVTMRPVFETAIWKPLHRRVGIWMSDALDSGLEQMEWHKIVLDCEQEADTQIIVRGYASDSKEVIIGHQKVDLDQYIKDHSVTPEDKLAALSEMWSMPITDPLDALLFDMKGRYMWLYLELIGSVQHTPVVHSLEVHFPRETYLKYLPSIYAQDEASRDFLGRYLSLYQSMIDHMDQKVTHVTRAFDLHGAQGNSLRWLLGWLGIEGEDYWTEEQLRVLLKYAPKLYRLRGTKYAMEMLLSIYTGEKPIILEYEQVKPLKENPELGEVTQRLYAADPHVFNVLIKLEHADTEMKRVILQQLIDSFKPAFATCKMIILQPWVYMDLHSYLGMNTVLSEPTLLTLDGRSSMPHHTITIDLDQDNRMDQHTRLGLDSRLE